jgi:hypothetical protein
MQCNDAMRCDDCGKQKQEGCAWYVHVENKAQLDHSRQPTAPISSNRRERYCKYGAYHIVSCLRSLAVRQSHQRWLRATGPESKRT